MSNKEKREGYHDPADLEMQDPKTQALFRLQFALYERQDALVERLEDAIAGLEGVAGAFLADAPPFIQQMHGRAKMVRYLTKKRKNGDE